MFLGVDLPGHFLGLFTVAAEDDEFASALLAVPDGESAAEAHGNTDFA